MTQTMEVSAFARVDDATEIEFLTAREGLTEFVFDRDGLVLTATEGGLGRLADAVNAAVRDRQSEKAVQAPS